MKRALPLSTLAVALVLAGCGGGGGTSSVATTVPATTGRTTTDRAPTVRPPARASAVLVTVIDGNTRRPVAGARVTIGRRSARTGSRGVAALRLRRRAALVTTVRASGYLTKSLRLPFRTRPRSTVRLYATALQWPMYGVDQQRRQAQNAIRLRPPFRVIWSHGTGSLTEFPAVVSEGVAYVANYNGTVEALSMANGHVLWRHPTPEGKMASSPAVWGDKLVAHGMDGHVWVLRRSDGRLVSRFAVGAPIESSPVVRDGVDYFGTWDGRVYALDLRRQHVRWRFTSGCKITSSASISGGTLFIGDYCGRLLALRLATGAERWAGSVNGRIYGTPAVAGGRVFVPSSSGGSMSAFTTGGPAALEPHGRLVRLLVACGLERPCLLRLLRRRLLRRLGRDRQHALDGLRRRLDLGRRRGRRRRRLCGLVRAPDHRRRRPHRPRAARLPARAVRPGLG